MVTTLVGIGALYVLFKVLVPLLLLALVVYFAFQWANSPHHEFSSAEPTNLRGDLDDDLRDDVRGSSD
jgi:hypothetical protein